MISSKLTGYKTSLYNPSLIIALILVINSGILYWNSAINGNKGDFFVFWAVPYCLSDIKTDNIYSIEGKKEFAEELKEIANSNDVSLIQKETTKKVYNYYKGIIDTLSTPFFYSFFKLISSGDYEKDRMRFIILSMLCYIISILLLCKIFKIPPVMSLLLLALFLFSYTPIRSDLLVGNVNQLQLFNISLFGAVLVISKRFYHYLIAGIIIGLGIMFKPNLLLIPVFVAILYLIDKQFQKFYALMIGSFTGGLVALIASLLYFGRIEVWIDFIRTIPNTIGLQYSIETGNYSLTSLFYYLTGSDLSIVFLPAFILIFILLLWISRVKHHKEKVKSVSNKDFEKEDIFLAIGIGSATTLLTMGLSWFHYYLLFIPLYLLIFRPTPKDSKAKTKTLIIRIIAIISFLQLSFPGTFFSDKLIYNPIKICLAASLVAGIAFYKIWFQRKHKCFV